MNVEIKQLRPRDEHLLTRIAEDVFDEAIDPYYLSAYLAEANHYMIVALHSGEVVGQIRAIIHKHPDRPHELYIDNLGVTPKYQRQGIASKLLNAMLKLGKQNGCKEAWLATESNNAQAQGFYNTYGIQPEGMVFYLFKL